MSSSHGQGARRIILILFAGGILTLAIAIIGPWLGMGLAEQSRFYVWFGLTRTNLAIVGTASVALAIGVALPRTSRGSPSSSTVA
jgi:hypothetical protein